MNWSEVMFQVSSLKLLRVQSSIHQECEKHLRAVLNIHYQKSFECFPFQINFQYKVKEQLEAIKEILQCFVNSVWFNDSEEKE